MRNQALGTVALWLAGGAVLAADQPGTTGIVAAPPPLPAAKAPPPADFPPPALPPMAALPPIVDPAPQTLPSMTADVPPLSTGQSSEPPIQLVPYTKDSPYFAIARLASLESRSSAPPPIMPLNTLPGLKVYPPIDTTPRDLRDMPEMAQMGPGGSPYYGMAVPTPVGGPMPAPTPAACDAPAVLHDYGTTAWNEGFGHRFFGSADYVLFDLRRGPTPPLVQTVTPAVAQTALNTGELPAGGATTLFGEKGIDYDAFSGFRGQIGFWFNNSSTFGVDASVLWLEEQTTGFNIRSAGLPVIGRGFFDVAAEREAFLFYSTPDGVERGFINVAAATRMYGGDANLRFKGSSVFADRTDFVMGLRYLNLRDSLSIDSGADIYTPAGVLNQTIRSFESFRTRNQFYGSQAGVESHFHYGNFTLDLSGKVATGWVHQEVEIAGGSQSTIVGQPTQTLPNRSILYVQPTNAGNYKRDEFAILPELLIKLGYQVTPHIRATVGYDLLYVSNVIRPGNALDAGVNPSNTDFIAVQQPNTARRPAFSFDGTDFWAQGLTAGLVFTY
jgi:hypothetical protein